MRPPIRYISVIALAAGLGLATAVSASTASAAPPPGNSTHFVDGLSNLPCDGVIYPVLESKNSYEESAGTTQNLPVGLETTLKVANKKTTTNQVQVVKMSGVQFTLEWAPKFADTANGKASLVVTHQTTTTYTNGSSVDFSQENSIKIKPKSKGLSATPIFIKMQGWGATYKCETGTSKKELVGDPKSVKVDLVLSAGWKIEKDGQPASTGDYSR